ncbi:MAG: hypothetical protein JRF33_17620, partial [Deltaproteobacteria bacterium]|nr:hypothetical protein [Deltaproteobacteria bacterium]
MFARSILVILAVLSLGFVLGCGDSDSGDDVECIRDTDCEAGQICRNAHCVDEGDPCLMVQCDPGYRCQDGACVPVDPCSTMTCEDPPGDADCYVSPGTCSAGVCSYSALSDGAACDDGDACSSADVCTAGYCAGAPIECSDPPADVCLDEATLRTHVVVGLCDEGQCSYSFEDTICEFQCADAQCRAYDYCGELGAMRCVGSLVQTCNNSTWQTVVDCSSAAMNCEMLEGVAQCALFICQGGQTRCQGDLLELCVDNRWLPYQDCSTSDQHCLNGACESCTLDCTNRICGDDGCGGSCGECEVTEQCVDGDCLQVQVGLCPDGLTCGLFNWGDLTLCLEDGQIPIDAPSCGETMCPNNMGCFFAETGGEEMYCLEICGECPDGEICGPLELDADFFVHLCLVGGLPPDDAPACDADYMCEGNAICASTGDEYLCFNACSAPHDCVPACMGLECGDDGCGGSCGNCPVDANCMNGHCVAGLCPTGQSCDVYGEWQVNSCLQDGQIPTDNESCNNVGEFCPQPNQVCADRFDGTL